MNSSPRAIPGNRRGKKLFYILDRLTPEEQVDLGHWLGSALHANSPQFVAMLQVILKAMASHEEPELDAAMFTEILSPDREMDAKKAGYVWVRVSQLQDAVLDFLAWTRYRRDPTAQRRYLLEEVCDRGWERYIPEAYKEGIDALPKTPQARRYMDELAMEVAYCRYLAGQREAGQDKHLREIHQALDHHYCLQKLKYACAGIIDGDHAADADASETLRFVLHHLGGNLESWPTVIKAYWFSFSMLSAELQEHGSGFLHFAMFRDLFENPKVFQGQEAMDLFIHAQNYCVLRWRKGDGSAVTDLEGLYQSILQHEIGLQGRWMTIQFYRNTVELFCRMGHLDWVERFIERYRYRITHDPGQVSHAYNVAVLHWFKGAYKEVARGLFNRLGDLDRLQMGADARLYLGRSLWEVGEFEWLRNVLVAFEQHVRRNQEMKPLLRKRFKSFLKLFRQACEIVQGNPGRLRAKMESLLEELDAAPTSNAHAWLRLKILEVLGR